MSTVDTEEEFVVGESVEDMVAGDETLPEIPAEPPISGFAAQLSLLAGGEEPTSSSMVMRGGKIPVEGEFDKGDRLRMVVELRVAEVNFIDKIDTDGYVVSTERKHVAKVTSVRRLED